VLVVHDGRIAGELVGSALNEERIMMLATAAAS
jgi:hypothetical protein